LFGLALLFGVVVLFGALLRRTPANAFAQPTEKAEASPRRLVGNASCAASVCHGGTSIGQPLSEAATWQSLDPHARAYDTLLKPVSKTIAERLWKGSMQAHDAPLCLRCHVHPAYDQARPNFRKADGVGCESCHGAAQDWLTPHYRPEWKKSDHRALGFADTKTLNSRVELCARCHVGTPVASVDHDLIAAGHPALRFEFATYFANLPPHWDVQKDKRANSTAGVKELDFELRAWVVGQTISAACALDLLAHRADPANKKPWSEFSEHDCFACHHELQPASWRQKKQPDRRLGSIAWSQWYFVGVSRDFIQATPQHALSDPPLFSDFRPQARDRIELSKKASLDATKLRQAAKSKFLVGSIGLDSPANWEEAAQYYLSLLSQQQYRKDNQYPANADEEKRVEQLRKQVTLESGFAPQSQK
jgi:hypothetical protein